MTRKMRVLVLGDLSGRSNRRAEDATDLGTRAVHKLDLDRFDAVLSTLRPSLHLSFAGDETALGPKLQFGSLDDFHPDRLLQQLNLLDSAQRQGAPGTSNSVPATTRPESLLEGLMGGAVSTVAKAAPRASTIVDDLIRRTIQSQPQTQGDRSPAPYAAAAESSMAQALRSVLHHRDVQALESAWRGLRRFVEDVDMDEGEVDLFVMDATQAELLADAAAHAGDVSASGLHQALKRGSAIDDVPWSLLIGHFSINADSLDLALLAHMGSIAAQLRAPLLASADPSLAGASSVAELARPARWSIEDDMAKLWMQLRRSPVAPWIGLTLPRLLLRQPYGAKSDPIEAFAFEERATPHAQDGYLWGSSALACGQAIAQSFIEHDSRCALRGAFDVGDLPAVVCEQDGERTLLPCAELLLQTETGEKLSDAGFIPLLSYANRNAVRVMGLQSIAEPTRRLAGLD